MNFGIGKETSHVVDSSVKRAGSGRNKDMGRIKSRIEIEIGGNGMKKRWCWLVCYAFYFSARQRV